MSFIVMLNLRNICQIFILLTCSTGRSFKLQNESETIRNSQMLHFAYHQRKLPVRIALLLFRIVFPVPSRTLPSPLPPFSPFPASVADSLRATVAWARIRARTRVRVRARAQAQVRLLPGMLLMMMAFTLVVAYVID